MKNRFCADFIKKNQEFMSTKNGTKTTKYSYCE